jgi:hypothetical protein
MVARACAMTTGTNPEHAGEGKDTLPVQPDAR